MIYNRRGRVLFFHFIKQSTWCSHQTHLPTRCRCSCCYSDVYCLPTVCCGCWLRLTPPPSAPQTVALSSPPLARPGRCLPRVMGNCFRIREPLPDWALTRGGNSNKELQGARPKNSQRHRLCTHNCTYNLDYVSNDLDYVSKKIYNNFQLVKRV